MKTPLSLSWLGILLLLDAAGLGWVALVLFRVSTGSGRALLFGLSAQSLLLVGLTLLAAIVFLAVGLLTLRGKFSAERLIDTLLRRPAWSIGLLTTLAIACWLLAWTPAEYFKSYYYYALRLIPLAGWLSFASGTFALFLSAAQRGIDGECGRDTLRQNRAIFLVSMIALLAFALIAWLASQRVVGMNPAEEDFWYGAGTPVLAWQVLTAILVGLGVAWGQKKFLHNGTKDAVGRVPADVLVFIILWVVAGFLWAQAPIATNFMISPPYPPNFEYYPAADGANYDIASQYALIGQGLFDGGQMRMYFERPLYAAFLYYLHTMVGQDFALLLNLQAAIYAVLPAIAYLIGKNIHSRGAGVALAVLLTLRGVNGLETGAILENSTQKMLLTDFPTAIGLALILLLAIRWAQQPHSRWQLAGWMGGCIGLWGFVRPHILFLLPVGMFLAVLLYYRRKRIAAAIAGFMLLAYLAITLPWVQFNGSGMSLISMYLWRVQAIINERFHWPTPSPNGSLEPRQVASLDLYNILPQPLPKPLAEFALDHFLNNLALAPLSLPTTLRGLDLASVIQTETFWKAYWDGALSPSAKLLVPVNLLLIALGIGLAWKRARFIGLFPLFGMLVYFLINSLVRTSGGRYLVPADWVVILYYVLGLAALFEIASAWFGNRMSPVRLETQTGRGNPILQGLVVLALLGGIGSVIPLAGSLHPQRYEQLDKFQVAAKFEQPALGQPGVNPAEIQAFLAQEQAIAMDGRALYPRHIWRSVNPLIPFHLLQPKPYSRMTFTLLGAGGHQPVVLVTGDEWFPLPHTAEAIVLGCQEDGFLNAWGVYLPESGALHLRLPETPLRCPLPEPVCDNNGWCRYE